MRKFLFAAVAILMMAFAPAAFAQAPVNPSTMTVDLPQTNADGSNLVDLANVRFCVGPAGSAALLNCVTVPVTTPDPPAGASATTPIAAFNLTADGPYEAAADATDSAGNRGAQSARAPFSVNRMSPGAPSTPRFQ